MSHMLFRAITLTAVLSSAALAAAQQVPGTVPGTTPNGYHIISPVVQPTLTPGTAQLIELELKFAEDTVKGGGKAFAAWFADDAVTLSNGKPAVLGRGAIAANAKWDSKDYLLTWTAQGAQMSASNDMGFTWGHYIGKFKDANGKPMENSGRYITVWKKLPDGSWKVALDASADDAPDSGSCCALPKP
jgi:ketosteroid isomerase-like protein